MLKNKALSYICLIGVAIGIVSCADPEYNTWHFAYHQPIQQGNYINKDQLNNVKIGMDKDSVENVLGSPASKFAFSDNQWQYIYQQYTNDKLVKKYTVNVSFDANNLVSKVVTTGKVFDK